VKLASPSRKPRRVKAAFIGPFAIVLTFIMGVFLVTLYLIEVRILEGDLAERAEAVANLFAQKIERDSSMMHAVLYAMMTNSELANAFVRRDRQALEREAGPLFKMLRTDRLTHLYFTGPDLVNVLRLHQLDEFGDVINRATMLKAQASEEPVHGLELGPLGTLTLRLVTPWRRNKDMLGYLEAGEEIEHLVEEVHDSLSVDLLVLVDKRYLQRQQWQRGLALMNRQGEWERFSSFAMVAQTTNQVPAALSDKLVDDLRTGLTLEIKDNGRSFHVAMLPLNDAGGHIIGDLVVMRDITDLQATFRWSIAAVSLLCLLGGGGVLGLFYFYLERIERDYQRQHDLEHQLLRLSTEHHRILQLEKLSALGTMVGGIAHQLNNPLVGVVNMAQLAEREAEDPVRTRELLAEIRSAGEDCRTFVRRMLEFSKVSCFDSKPTTMAPLIDDTVLLFRQADNRHLPVETRLPAEQVVIAVDPVLIRHALFNLMINAAQATAGDGAIIIGLDRALSSESGAPGWLLSVTDHGNGIAPDVMDKIFVPFFTTRSDGTGLGLPVVQYVALLHDGYVTAANQPEGGAIFALWLPENESNAHHTT